MLKTLRKSLAKKMILLAFVVGLISPSAQAYFTDYTGSQNNSSQAGNFAAYTGSQLAAVNEVAPAITNIVFNQNTYNGCGNAIFTYNINNTQKTTVDIMQVNNTNAEITKNLMFDTTVGTTASQNGSCTWSSFQEVTCTWNGKNAQAQAVGAGTYKAKVIAYNSVATTSAEYMFTVTTGAVVGAPVVSNVVANPNPFNPNTQSTTISFTTDKTADVLVEIFNDVTGQLVSTINAGSGTGTRSVTWNGAGTSDNTKYRIKVTASNAAGSHSAFAFVNVDFDGQQGDVPVISNVYAQPTPFDPEEENTRIYFTLDRQATVTVKILDGNNTVATLASNVSKSSGTHYYEWNGREQSTGGYVNDGTYIAKVYAFNNAGEATPVSTAVVVDRDGSNVGCNIITSHYATKSTFDPEEEDVLIHYAHNQPGYVTVRIKDGSSTVRTLVDHDYYSSGSRYIAWNGRNTSGNYVSDRNYTYEIKIELSTNVQNSNCYSDTETGTVRVDRDGDTDGDENDWPSTDEDLITNVSVDNEVFDPKDDERAKISYRLNDRADVKVQVMDGNKVVRTLANVNDQNEGNYSYYWDGRDTNGKYVSDRVYQFRIMADSGDETDTDRAYVEVDTDGIIIGFPDNARCAGFKDVSKNSPFCKAIELMSKKNIFDGYSDGTFRPNAKINRAEATKVIVLALGYDVPSDSYVGKLFKDTVANTWYSRYLWVAKNNNIIDGYPDGYFRPAKTINRVELLKIFLEANNVDADYCQQPFADTPNTPDTAWYMKYACFAKENDLMGSENSNRLYPAEPMTRGDVADLFYDFEVKGLYDYYGSGNKYDSGYKYEYDYNNNEDEDGYYVYQNGKYVWVSY